VKCHCAELVAIAATGMLFLEHALVARMPRATSRWGRLTELPGSGDKLTPGNWARGANDSLIHVDWMIGSGKVDVDGITASAGSEPVMRQGNGFNFSQQPAASSQQPAAAASSQQPVARRWCAIFSETCV